MIYKNIELSDNGLVKNHEGIVFGDWKYLDNGFFSADFKMAHPRIYGRTERELARKINAAFFPNPENELPKPIK